MSANKEIIDYAIYSEEIEKWLALKGETKYMRFASILNANGIVVKWNVLKDTYRYDKRLLVNIFKYLSFFEEFLRAQIWNISQISYNKLEGAFLAEIMNEVLKFQGEVYYAGFSIDTLEENRDYINYLRNRVSHNKILLESKKDSCNLQDLLVKFKLTLPTSYQMGFIKDINGCTQKLNVPNVIIIKI